MCPVVRHASTFVVTSEGLRGLLSVTRPKCMNESRAFCPECRQETVFVERGGLRSCSQCGFQSKLHSAPAVEPSTARHVAVTVVSLLLRGLLILVAVVLVGAAVIFGGCVLMMSGGRFGH